MPADEMEQLAFKNRFVRQLVQTMTDYEASDATPQIVSGPDNMIILQVSLEEWIKLTSSVFTGADICYPDESDSVRWILFRAVEQPVDLCALIAQCIENSPATRAAIRDLVLTDPEINQHISDIALKITEAQIVGKIIEGSCDKSVVAGKVVAIVERMDDINVDFLEIIEVGTNDEEKVANVLSAIPGLSESPVDEIIDFVQDMLEDFSENYNAAVTEDWLNEVEEDLYCLARQQEDCSLTYQQLFDYFQERVGSNLTVQSVIQNVLDWVINGDFSTDDLIASGMYAMQLAFILAGQEFAGMNVPKIGSLTRDALPSTKWEDWDECNVDARWPMVYKSADFASETLTFIERDGDWDVWTGTSVFLDPPAPAGSIGPTFSNGQTYAYGVNVGRADDGTFLMDTDFVDSNNLWSFWYIPPSLFDAREFPTADPVLVAQIHNSAPVTFKFRVKGTP